MRRKSFGWGNCLATVRWLFASTCVVVALAQATSAAAQTAVTADAAANQPSSATAPLASPEQLGARVAPPALPLPANTVIELEMIDTVSSKTSKRDDFFKLRVAVDVKSGDVVLIPAGTPVVGQVVHAQRAHGGGKAGELILAARYLDLPQGQVKLHSSFGASGRNRFGASVAGMVAFGVLGFLIKGKDVELAAGSPLSARLAADTLIVAPH